MQRPTGAGTAQMKRHAPSPRPSEPSVKMADAPKPPRMPRQMNPSLSETSSPRRCAGAVSEMYVGAACIEKAIPSPYSSRPPTTHGTTAPLSGADAVNTVPSMYRVAPTMSSRRRPSGSPAKKTMNVPANAPMSDEDVSSDCCPASKPAAPWSMLPRLLTAPDVAPMS